MITVYFLYTVLCFIFGVLVGDYYATKGEK